MDVYFIPLDMLSRDQLLRMMYKLRELNISCEMAYRSTKIQLKKANKYHAKRVIILAKMNA